MRKFNVFYEGDGSLSGSVLYDTAALSTAISSMDTAFSDVKSIFTEMSQDSFFSDGSWECEAADNAKASYDTIKSYCTQVEEAYSTYTAFLQNAVDSDFTDVGTKIVNAINSGNSE